MDHPTLVLTIVAALPDADRASSLAALTGRVPYITDRHVTRVRPQPWVEQVRRTTEAAGLPSGHFHVGTFAS